MVVEGMRASGRAEEAYFAPEAALEQRPPWLQRLTSMWDPVRPRLYRSSWGALRVDSIHWGYGSRIFLLQGTGADAASHLELEDGPPTTAGWQVISLATGTILATPHEYSICTRERMLHGNASQTLLLLASLVVTDRMGDNQDERLNFQSLTTSSVSDSYMATF